ncbi:alpha/beta hydrolase [Paenibacillus sp. MMS20-IR301]|uniref:alpha/beta fold hydrolase n=1 Tax=Paenibacillus sp. MMS20-IR301 TaxID=2895946 RepID=UPI0028F03647|nr:alpha/beta hydrolase [Paenibacillus sp. MMS20-IR301]WNS46287.1 alpha/beta hydrolase [Paenibacillus sp. MMS20-IR301]
MALHVLESGKQSSGKASLLIIGGLWEPAERAIPLLANVPGHVLAFSFRGRGLSSTPATGYGLEDHLSDIAAVVRHCRLENYYILGFSRGAAYALGWSLQHQEQMKGLILVDQPPLHRSLSAEAVNFWSSLVYQEVPILNYMRLEAIQGLARDAREVDFSAQLPELLIPVTLFAGRNKTAELGSDLSDETLHIYRTELPFCAVVEFDQSGHMIPDEEQQKYIAGVSLCIQ